MSMSLCIIKEKQQDVMIDYSLHIVSVVNELFKRTVHRQQHMWDVIVVLQRHKPFITKTNAQLIVLWCKAKK